MRNKFITTAIYYPNGKPHLGYTYELILADAISRYHKVWLRQETFFLTGADEHGQKIADKAESEGKTEQQLVDEFADVYKDFEARLGVSYDRFVRTTDPDHSEVCKNLWLRILENNDLYEKEYSGLYCVGCESFKNRKRFE
jgi:methionyl-tRNA synthetase